MKFNEIASGLHVGEGPIALADGTFLVCEVLAGRVTRVTRDGQKQIVATIGGGANGAAIGPDGRCYVCNNGGLTDEDLQRLQSGIERPDSTAEPEGRIDVIDLETGKFATLYETCNGTHLVAPNDLVFDAQGGFYFTDFGPLTTMRPRPGHIYYATPDGKTIRHAVGPLVRPNGVGLSPDEKTVYTAESSTGRVWAFDVVAPGQLKTETGVGCGGRLLLDDPELALDSLAVESSGYICVAAPGNNLIVRVAPDGSKSERIPTPEGAPSNICFGGAGLKTAYITFLYSGKFLSAEWPQAGLPLNFLNR